MTGGVAVSGSVAGAVVDPPRGGDLTSNNNLLARNS